MRPALFTLLASAFALPAAIPAACAAPGSATAAEAAEGEVSWTIEADPRQRSRGEVQFGLSRRTGSSRWMHSNTRPLAGLDGLTAEQLGSASGTPVAFRLDRDAGTIACEGVARRWHAPANADSSPAPDSPRRSPSAATDGPATPSSSRWRSTTSAIPSSTS